MIFLKFYNHMPDHLQPDPKGESSPYVGLRGVVYFALVGWMRAIISSLVIRWSILSSKPSRLFMF